MDKGRNLYQERYNNLRGTNCRGKANNDSGGQGFGEAARPQVELTPLYKRRVIPDIGVNAHRVIV